MTFGPQPGAPKLLVLDSTDPVQIGSFRDKIDPARTLFCVSSKSGTALEPNIYMQYFYDKTKKIVGDQAGHHFIAVTDPGSKLETVAKQRGFRHIYHGVPSIGGRYSALSPISVLRRRPRWASIRKHFCSAQKAMVEACKKTPAADNPGVRLGLILERPPQSWDAIKSRCCVRTPFTTSAPGWSSCSPNPPARWERD